MEKAQMRLKNMALSIKVTFQTEPPIFLELIENNGEYYLFVCLLFSLG